MSGPNFYSYGWPELTNPVDFDEGVYNSLYSEVDKAFFGHNGYRSQSDIDYRREQATDTISVHRQMFIASLQTERCADTLGLFGRLASPGALVPAKHRESARFRVGQAIMCNFESFAAVAEGDDPVLAEAATNLIFDAAESFGLFGQGEEENRQVTFLIGNLRLTALSRDPASISRLDRLVDRNLLRHCTDEQQEEIIEVACKLGEDEATRSAGASLIKGAVSYLENATIHNPLDGVKRALYEKFGMNFARLSRAWAHGHELGKPKDYERMNIEMILDLESRNPGICRALNERFNIRNFARCTAEMWEDQYQNMDNKDAEYGAMLYPEDDPNSAFYTIKEKIAGFHKQLKGLGCLLRIYECSSVEEAEKALTDAEDVYERQLEFAIASAHGKPKSMRFARHKDGQSCEALTYDAVEAYTTLPTRKRLNRLARQFAKDAKLLLYSCSTGEMSGLKCMGEILASALGVLVLAPNMDVAMRTIDASRKQNGGIDVSITFVENAVTNAFDGRATDQDTGSSPA